MTVQGVQNMVQEDLRCVIGLIERSNQSLSQVVYDRIQLPKRPNQLFNSRRLMGVGDFIKSRLSYTEYQCVEGIWKQNGWLFL